MRAATRPQNLPTAVRLGLTALQRSRPRTCSTSAAATAPAFRPPPGGAPQLVAPTSVTLPPEAWDNAALLVDKPQGWTSFDVCAKLRGAIHIRKLKVGHAGAWSQRDSCACN